MAGFSYTIRVYSPDRSRAEDLSLPVDSGSPFTWLHSSTLYNLGVNPERTASLQAPDGTAVIRSLGEATIEIDGRRASNLVVFAEGADDARIGRYTVDSLLLSVDVASKRLVPMIPTVA